jgi:hypothetical protein
MVSRRLFLGILGSSTLFDPERLLWLPGKKVISVPAPRARRTRYFAVDQPMGPDWRAVLTPAEFHGRIAKMREQLEANIKFVCEREMVRPRFLDIDIGMGGMLYAEHTTVHATGFKSRALSEIDVLRGRGVLRVDALFES